MPLRDHFRPPLGVRRHWHAFHNAWATYIASDLNRVLPAHYFAEPNVRFGIEIDVATFEEAASRPKRQDSGAVAVWTAPAPVRTIPLPLLTEVVEVLVFHQEGGPTLAGAIELVSPGNKDRPETRAAFVSKCAAYVQQGLGLVIVDVVTDRHGNLHAELLGRLGSPDLAPPTAHLYATAYRPVDIAGDARLDIWEEPLAVDEALPTLPLWLPGALQLPVDLGATFERTCREQRIDRAG